MRKSRYTEEQIIGILKQHEAGVKTEAGGPYAQLQEAGMRTARLDEIIRQKDPALKTQFDVQSYTNDAKALGYELSRDMSHPTAIQQEATVAQKIEPQSESIQAAQCLSEG